MNAPKSVDWRSSVRLPTIGFWSAATPMRATPDASCMTSGTKGCCPYRASRERRLVVVMPRAQRVAYTTSMTAAVEMALNDLRSHGPGTR
jgi:hypothetical protein